MKVDHSTYIIIEQQSYSIHLPLSLSLSLSLQAMYGISRHDRKGVDGLTD
jgi:hypothetical protein